MNMDKFKEFTSNCEIGEATEEQGINMVKELMKTDITELEGKDLATAADVLQGLATILSERLFANY